MLYGLSYTIYSFIWGLLFDDRVPLKDYYNSLTMRFDNLDLAQFVVHLISFALLCFGIVLLFKLFISIIKFFIGG